MRHSLLLPLFFATLARPFESPVKESSAVLAGGCFWGVEWVFEHVRGVKRATSGYVGPVESVQIIYDPAQVSYRQLLEIFFTVAHDPTSRDRQGPDAGPEYRAVVYTQSEEQRAQAATYIAELTTSRRYAKPIVTEVQTLTSFRIAEAYHQNYAERNPTSAYIAYNDVPKIKKLQKEFPALYHETVHP